MANTVFILLLTSLCVAANASNDVRMGNSALKYEAGMNTDTLISLISVDSIASYSHALEDFDTRLSGTSSNADAALWLAGKFDDFGYDSVEVSTFIGDIGGQPTTCRNIIAVRNGTEYPKYQIIVGAHFDAVEISPGADDNGSGTSAVLEIARAFSNFETNLTFKFILFDAEEAGLVGSWLYASLAAARRDHIVLMFNLDMIGYIDNDTDAYIKGNNQNFVQLWTDLAQSLPEVGITAHLYGRGTDSDPFREYGYDAVDVFEFEPTPYYHTPHDSTVYLNYDYISRIVMATAVMLSEVDSAYIPAPELFLSYDYDTAGIVIPGRELPVELFVEEWSGASLVPGSVRMHLSLNDAPYEVSDMVEIGGSLFIDTISTLACHDRISYYFSADDTALGTFYFPGPDKVIEAVAATGTSTVFYDDFADDQGWTASSNAAAGQWERTTPYLGWWGAPAADYDGYGLCYLTQSGLGYDVDAGTVSLISPEITLPPGDAVIQYARWYSNSTGTAPNSDVFNILISGDHGASWTLIETVGPVEQASGGWYLHQCWIGQYLEPAESLMIRFDASDLGEDSQVEAAVDVVCVRQYGYGPLILTQNLPAWTAGLAYYRQLDAASCSVSLTWTDTYGHLEGSGLGIDSSGAVSGIPLNSGILYFSVSVIDDEGRIDSRMYSLRINPELIVTTAALPDATAGGSYSFSLSASGGTGAKIWQDKSGVLVGTGLVLEPGGLLHGVPDSVGTFELTARVQDSVGAFGERELMLNILSAYVCGDANTDQSANVADAVYLINYIFKSGPAPDPLAAGDANCDGQTNVGDAVYLINFVFKSGPAPCCP